MILTKDLIADIIEWDVVNWSNALRLWDNDIKNHSNQSLNCLELGGRKGGCSLWLAHRGHSVICSDVTNPQDIASALHQKYAVDDKIVYEAIDAVNIPYEDHFDVIVLKSIIGGVSHSGQDELQKKMIDSCHKALKVGGKLYYAENLAASSFHQFMRKKFVGWGDRWNYLRYHNIPHIFSNFKENKYSTCGFLGTFGRSEKQRNVLGKFDGICQSVIPKNMRYIVYGVAQK